MKLRKEDLEIAYQALDNIASAMSLDEVNRLRDLVIAYPVTFEELWHARDVLTGRGFHCKEIAHILHIAAHLTASGIKVQQGMAWVLQSLKDQDFMSDHKTDKTIRKIRFKGKKHEDKAKDEPDLQQRLRALETLQETMCR